MRAEDLLHSDVKKKNSENNRSRKINIYPLDLKRLRELLGDKLKI